MMTIPTLEHVIEAVQTAVKKYPGGVRAKLLGALIIDLMETETAVRHEERRP